jgi:hypothetical protein
MNYTIYDYQGEPIKIIIDQKNDLNLIGIFISSLLLSLSGLIAVLFSGLRNSRCNEIKCLGSSCTRNVAEV